LKQSLAGLDIRAENIALSNAEGETEFVGGAVSHVFTTVTNSSAYSIDGERSTIRCARLDSYPLRGKRMVLKIDVEGQEIEVLEGARRFFEEGRVLAVYIDGYKSERVPEFLRAHGFELLEGRTLAPATSREFSLLGVRSVDRSAS
jgi:hypothetical protein